MAATVKQSDTANSGLAGPSQAPVSLRDIARTLALDDEPAAARLCADMRLPAPVAGPEGEPAVSLARLREGVRLCSGSRVQGVRRHAAARGGGRAGRRARRQPDPAARGGAP